MAHLGGLHNLKFPDLLVCDVKRLTRPRFNHEFTQFNDRAAFSRLNGEGDQPDAQADLLGLNDDILASRTPQKPQKAIELFDIEEDYDPSSEQSADFRDQQWDNLGTNRHDVAYDGVSADCALNYISTFGKISTGEVFRVLFTIQNDSSAHALQNINMKVRV